MTINCPKCGQASEVTTRRGPWFCPVCKEKFAFAPEQAATGPLVVVRPEQWGTLVVCIIIGLAVGAVIGRWSAPTQPHEVSKASDTKPVHVFRGSGDGATPEFDVKDDWWIEYETRRGGFWFSLYDSARNVGNPEVGLIDAEAVRKQNGTIKQQKGGRYCIQAQGTGPWKLSIFQGSNTIP